MRTTTALVATGILAIATLTGCSSGDPAASDDATDPVAEQEAPAEEPVEEPAEEEGAATLTLSDGTTLGLNVISCVTSETDPSLEPGMANLVAAQWIDDWYYEVSVRNTPEEQLDGTVIDTPRARVTYMGGEATGMPSGVLLDAYTSGVVTISVVGTEVNAQLDSLAYDDRIEAILTGVGQERVPMPGIEEGGSVEVTADCGAA